MKGAHKITWAGMITCLFMMATMFWLCISAPFIYALQEQSCLESREDIEHGIDNNIPLSNPGEESTENNSCNACAELAEISLVQTPSISLPGTIDLYPVIPYLDHHPDPFLPPPESSL